MTPTPDHRKARLVMELRQQSIRNQPVLEAMERIPRELFVDPSFADQAYADRALPIACGQTISQPYIVAYMTDRLEVTDRSKVLEIGTGSGYQAAILSRLARRVYTVERYRSLLKAAEERFRELGLRNITSMVGDGMRGWPAQAPFDRIIVTAAARIVPAELLSQLGEGGIMVVPVENAMGEQELRRIRHTGDEFVSERLLPVRFVPLVAGVARER